METDGDRDPRIDEYDSRIVELEKQVEFFKSRCIAGFYEEEVPEFTQGAPTHELQDYVTAAEVTGYVAQIQELQDLLFALSELLLLE